MGASNLETGYSIVNPSFHVTILPFSARAKLCPVHAEFEIYLTTFKCCWHYSVVSPGLAYYLVP